MYSKPLSTIDNQAMTSGQKKAGGPARRLIVGTTQIMFGIGHAAKEILWKEKEQEGLSNDPPILLLARQFCGMGVIYPSTHIQCT